MRIWSLHPKYLDTKGLVAVWRETLLAKKVLEGNTNGYKNHPQLNRFKTPHSLELINSYLYYIHKESITRGYKFDFSKIEFSSSKLFLPVTSGQIDFEFNHLRSKTKLRSPEWYEKLKDVKTPDTHPLFFSVDGPVENWERF